MTVDCDRNDNQYDPENPQADHDCNKNLMAQLSTQTDMHEGVQSNCKHEHATHRIADLQPDSLQEASRVGSVQRVLGNPPQTDDEAQSLDEICQRQVVHEHNILVVSDIPPVVLFPKYETIGEEAQQAKCGNERNHGQRRDDNQTGSLQVRQWVDDP